MSVPNIAVLRERAATIIARASSGQMRAMLAGICAAKNTGDPLPADSTGQELITQCQGIIDQAESDALAIFVRELMEFVENAGGGGGGGGPPVFEGPNPGAGTEAASYSGQIIVSGTLPMTYTVDSGTLPTGTTLNANTGLISGTATTAGDYSLTIRATNSAGTQTQAFSISIAGRAPLFAYPLTGTPPGNTFPTPGPSYLFVSQIFGIDNVWVGPFTDFSPTAIYADSSFGSTPVTWSLSGTLPDGLAIDASTGEFTGIPNNVAQADNSTVWTMNITATNAYGSLTLGYKFIMFNF